MSDREFSFVHVENLSRATEVMRKIVKGATDPGPALVRWILYVGGAWIRAQVTPPNVDHEIKTSTESQAASFGPLGAPKCSVSSSFFCAKCRESSLAELTFLLQEITYRRVVWKLVFANTFDGVAL